jgi:pseudouridine synthase
MEERLQKYIARAGVCSRRAAEQLIASGRVTVNGQVVSQLGTKVMDTDNVCVDQKLVKPVAQLIYVMLYKPEGYVTTSHDQFDRPVAVDLVRQYNARIYPIGRLDYDTSGLLLLTNDGDLTQKLTHPSHEVEKVYIAQVRGVPTAEELNRFREGLHIEDYVTAPAHIHIIKQNAGGSSLKISIHEGRNRQVRKMCEAIGHPVNLLKRVATGKLYLGELKRGQSRLLTPDEIAYLKKM